MAIAAGPGELPAPSAVLIVLDGWGLAPDGPGNAVSLADTPVFDELWSAYPHTQLTAGGRAVGLPDGQMGNSEVGHLNLGAGAVVKQDLTRIDEAAQGGELSANEVLREAFTDAERVHLIGLVSDGGVHSGWSHLEALIGMGVELGVPDLVLHAFTDGRDTLPTSAPATWRPSRAGCGTPGPVGSARWSAATSRWTATSAGTASSSPTTCSSTARAEHRRTPASRRARDAYERDETDEFIKPVLVGDEARIRPGDSVIAFNFRPDRMREITRALADPEFTEIDRGGAAPVRALRDDDRVRGGLVATRWRSRRSARRRRCRR